MNEIQIAIFFLVLSFAGSLIFATKKKSSNAASFFINLDLEYIFIGLIIFLMARSYGVHGGAEVRPYLSLIMSFMGLLIGSQFSVKLLKNVNYQLFVILVVTYMVTHFLLYGVFCLFGFDKPYMVALLMNTAMPYSVQLFGRLYRVPMKYLFYILLSASIYPAISITHYGLYIGLNYFTFKNMVIGGLIALSFAVMVSTYAQVNSKKGINTVSVIILIILTGVSTYFEVSPLMIGFMSGLLLANFHYGDVFLNTYGSFDRFFYLFSFIFAGIFLLLDVPTSAYFYLAVGSSVLVLFLTRSLLMRFFFNRIMPIKEEFISMMSIGILPIVLIMDYGLVAGLSEVAGLLWLFLLIYIVTEIMEYLLLRHETKNR